MPKFLEVVRLGIAVIMLAVFVYGIVFYIDAPIHPCGSSFCGKTGHLHTAAEYHAFLIWQTTLIITWAIGLPIQFGFWLWEKAKGR